jgi:3-oxoacyl-[acyl-carrier-protein] synthase I
MYRVAITGIGIVSCLGTDIETVGASLRQGKSGVVVDEKRMELGFRSPLTGAITNFAPHRSLSRKQLKTMPDFAVQAYTAAMDGLAMSGLTPEEIQNGETGLIFGCDSSCVAAIEQAKIVLDQGDTKGIGSGLIFRSMTSTVTMNLNTLLKTKGAFEKPGQGTEKLNIVRETVFRPPRVVLCNAAGFGGTNSCLILRFDV